MKKTITLLSVIVGTAISISIAWAYAGGILVTDKFTNGERLFPIGDNGKILTVDATRSSGLAWKDPSLIVNPIELMIIPGVVSWPNQPASITELNVGWREQYNLTNATKARIIAGINATGTGLIGVQYFNGSWIWLDGSADATSSNQSNTISLANKGLQNTAWFNLPSTAQADVTLRFVGSGGDGISDPQMVNVRLQIR